MLIQAALVDQKAGPVRWQELTLAEPQANEVRIRMVASGICHTDISVQHQHILTPLPIVLGHEGSGIIDAIGPGVVGFTKGDHVVISFSYCGHCQSCLEGHPAGCERLFALNFGGSMPDGTTRLCCNQEPVSTFFGQSSLSTYVVSHVNNLVAVPGDIDLRLLGPMACGIQTGAGTVLKKLKPGFGQSLVVFGCGGVGLSAIMAARLTGCLDIIAVDLQDSRLQLAKELGATAVLNPGDGDVIDQINQITGGGADFALESTGVPSVVVQALRSLRARGTVAVVGASGDTTLHIHDDFIPPNRTMVGVVEGDVIPKLFIPQLIEYYRRDRFPFDKLIQFYDTAQLDQALADMLSGKTIKPVIVF